MWMMVALSAIGFLILLGGAYYFMSKPAAAPAAASEKPAAASAASNAQKVTNPLQKYVEVVGLRMISEGRDPAAKFIVVNHSTSEIHELAANVKLWASTSRSEEDAVGSFSFKLPKIGPNESKELTEPLKTKMKMYELPDWQNATAEIEITSPATP